MLASAPTCNVREQGLTAKRRDSTCARVGAGCDNAPRESNKRSIREQEILIPLRSRLWSALLQHLKANYPTFTRTSSVADSVSSDGHDAVICVTGRTFMHEAAADVTPLTSPRASYEKVTLCPELFKASRWCKCRGVPSGLPDSNKKREWRKLPRVNIAERCSAKSPPPA